MTKQERIARNAKIKASRAYGKTIGEKKAMETEIANFNFVNHIKALARISYRKTQSFRDFNEWRVDIFFNGNYICHDIFETIEEAEAYASAMVA